MKNIVHAKIIMLLLLGMVCYSWYGNAWANQLANLRMGEHGAFTRIVFEFNNSISHTNPIKKDGDRLTILFPKTVAVTEHCLPVGMQKNQRVKSLLINKQGQDLCADIIMPSADFTTKMRYLQNPERLIVDIYGETIKPETLAIAVSPKTAPTALPKAVKAVKQEVPMHSPQSTDPGIYWPILLLINLVMVALLGLMQFAIVKIKKRVVAQENYKPPEFSDKGMLAIDLKIQEELKKYRSIAERARMAGI